MIDNKCTHRWRIADNGNGSHSQGVCTACHETRLFSNVFEEVSIHKLHEMRKIKSQKKSVI